MKTVILLVTCFIGWHTINAQESEDNEETLTVPFATIEEVPVFPGCEDNSKKDMRQCFQEMMQKHVAMNFRYPEEAFKKKIQGRVSAMFVIDIDGTITSIKTHGPNPILEEETRRIITLLPKMKAGKQAGKAVRVPFAIPITFKLR